MSARDLYAEMANRYRHVDPEQLRRFITRDPRWECAETAELSPIHLLDYERYVEQPRREGRDPMYDAMMAEALGPPAAEGAA